MLKINRTDLPNLYRRLSGEGALYLPVQSAGQTNFALWEEGAAVDLDQTKTVKSPKDLFFPQCETLYTCSRQDGRLSVCPEELQEQDFVVFGIRPCDVRALAVLDQVFLSEPVDTFYQARRRHGTLVSLACHAPQSSCFCTVFGIDCAAPEGDVAAWLTGEWLYWLPRTEKGQALTARLADLLAPAEEKAIEEEQKRIRSIAANLPYGSLSLKGWGGENIQEKFDSPLWEQLYRACLGCGTCTFVCPTCQCYDIRDYDTGHGVQRFRCWDSCMYSDFTMMAAGNNRTSQMQRFRQRFLHKLCYFPANNGGMFSCVGCGRCVEKCPQHLNIVKVLKAFEKEAEHNG